jgi:hypothetical protein
VTIIIASSLITFGITTPTLSRVYAAAAGGTPNASVQWSPISAPGTFEQVNERYAVQSGTLMNNNQFTFFTDVWHNVAHGNILSTRYDSNNNPSDTIVKFVNVLNPITHGTQNYQDMRFGTTIITPPFSSNDNGQHRNFLITNEVPSGYYIVNVLGKFGGTQNFGVVYTGKMLIPGTSGPATSSTASGTIGNQHSVIRVVVRDGSDPCHPGQAFDPTISECIGNVAPPTHAIAAPTGGQTCTAIHHLDPTFHMVCVPLGHPFPLAGQPYPPILAGAENCPYGFNWHIGQCYVQGGGCGPGAHVVTSAFPPYVPICEFIITPTVDMTTGYYQNVDNQQNAPATSGPTPPCTVDPTTGACINSPPTAVSGAAVGSGNGGSGGSTSHNHNNHHNGGTSNNGGGGSSSLPSISGPSPDNGGGGGPPVKGSGGGGSNNGGPSISGPSPDNGGGGGPAPPK